MTASDDRGQFENHKVTQSLSLDQEKAVFDASASFMLKRDPNEYSYLQSWV